MTVQYSGFYGTDNASVLDNVGFVLGTDYTQGKVFIVAADGSIEWEYQATSCNDLWVLPNGNLLFTTGHGVKEVTRGKQVVFDYQSRSEIHACHRLTNGNTFIGECNSGRLLEVEPSGRIAKDVRLLPEGKDGGHLYMRNARRLENGHYLVTHYGEQVVREYDGNGKVVREIPAAGGPLLGALRGRLLGVLVTDENEEWDTISPKLDSFEANNDGLTLKKFLAAGHGVPLHWLSEPESSTRTTAEAAGTPTFKTLEDRQKVFLSIVQEILSVAVARRAQRGDTTVDPTAPIYVTAGDVSERDNAALALATSQIVSSFGQLWNAGLISADELLRVVYRFAGEVVPSDRPDRARAPIAPSGSAGSTPGGLTIDARTGEVNVRGGE